jgi:phosphate transport system substrate-binding protein
MTSVNRRNLLLGTGAMLGAGLVMKRQPAHAQDATITGAGASFPAPVYQRWGEQAKQPTGLTLNYQAIGSGGGLNQITNRTVDFGASDAPVAADQLQQRNLLQFPTVLGAVVPIVNLPGVAAGQLKLTPELLADMFLGKVTRWSDARIKELNPGVSLPNSAIAVAHRADASGTSFVFTSYLAKVSSEWKEKVGAATSVSWPAGTGARGNDGVAATVKNVRGAIGYVENAYAEQNHLATVQLRNRDGKFVKPDMQAFRAAASNADWGSAQNFAVDLIDTHGAESWPIVSPTFILLPTNPQDAEKSRNVMRFFDWAYKNGDQAAEALQYIPLPDQVAERVRQAWGQQVKGPNGQPVWTGAG